MKILIAEDDPVSRRMLETTLVRWEHEVVATSDGAEAWRVLQDEDAPRLAILDWMMPGMDGTEICRRVRQLSKPPPIYIILLTAKGEKQDIVESLKYGADDYLTKPFKREELYARVQVGVRMADLQSNLADRVRQLERAEVELRRLTLTDELTGLCNRRGLLIHAEQHLKIARRTGKGFLIFYADMDDLKQINDTFGHAEGSSAIIKMAEVLGKTFRESDIIARLGGDEFSILAQDASMHLAERVTARLEENLQSYNAQNHHAYELSLSLGCVHVAPDNAATVEELVAKADKAMYEHKRSKRQTETLRGMDIASVR
jgi:diguanylate cyclase (GGDEF)-like protein